MKEFEDKIKVIDYKDFPEESFLDLLRHEKIISQKEYERRLRKLKLENLSK